MDIQNLVENMKAVSLKQLEAIAEAAGVPYSTALKIRGGFVKNPRINTVNALEPFFNAPAKRPSPPTASAATSGD